MCMKARYFEYPSARLYIKLSKQVFLYEAFSFIYSSCADSSESKFQGYSCNAKKRCQYNLNLRI